MKQKYKNRKTTRTVGGEVITFDSALEAKRFDVLKAREEAGEISALRLQPSYTLQNAFNLDGHRERAIMYRADFEYIDKWHRVIVEDVKGVKTDVYKIKRKIFLYKYGEHVFFKEITKENITK